MTNISKCPRCGAVPIIERIGHEVQVSCSDPDCAGIDWDAMPRELAEATDSVAEAIGRWNRAAALTALEVAA